MFHGSNGAEIFEVSANGTRVRFTRNLGNIVMDLDDLESLEVHALSNTDLFTVNDLAGTDLTRVQVGLVVNGIKSNVSGILPAVINTAAGRGRSTI